MIRLDEVAKKIQDILNGIDPEVAALLPGVQLPTDFQFMVETEGYHLDHIADMETGKNFIPVFISSMGGQINPVPKLKQANYVIPISIYFPVRFKEDMFRLNDYLADAFVGQYLNYGTNSGRAVSNISVAQFGEITNLDLKQFQQWVQTTYKKKIEIMEPFLQMSLNLYLSTVADGFVFTNKTTITLEYGESQETITFDNANVQSNAQVSSEQLIGATETHGVPFGLTYGLGFTACVKNNAFWRLLLKDWSDAKHISLDATLTIALDDDSNNDFSFTRKCFVQSVNLPITFGQLLSVTFSLTKEA